MKTEEDAVGQAIWACYEGRKSFEVVERDDGYFDVVSPNLYFSEFEDWGLHEKKAMGFAKGRILDLGCGAGRHALYLQKKGLDVLGIDKSPLAIKVCKLRGVRKVKVIPIENVNFKPNSFDTILLMGNNFALFGDFKKARRLLEKFHRITSEDSMVIAEACDPYKTDNPDQLEYYDFNKKRGRMSGQWRIRIRYRKYVTQWFDNLLVSKEEMRKILEGTEWKVKEFIDSNSPAYIAIIEKVKKESSKSCTFLKTIKKKNREFEP